MNKLYHGSITPNIKKINPISQLHNSDKKVVYLTDNIPYALFYIWVYKRYFVKSWEKAVQKIKGAEK